MRFSLGQEWKDGTCVGEAQYCGWANVLEAAEVLNRQGGYAGYCDWRMPTKEELQTLVYCSSGLPKTWNDTGKSCQDRLETLETPTIYQPIFPNTGNHIYWFYATDTETSIMGGTISFNICGGYVGCQNKNLGGFARLVRGGQ